MFVSQREDQGLYLGHDLMKIITDSWKKVVMGLLLKFMLYEKNRTHASDHIPHQNDSRTYSSF